MTLKDFGEIFAMKLLVFLFIIDAIDSAKILASVSTPSYSHQIAFRPIWKELAKRGHEIVLLTTDPMEETENIKQIDLSFSYDILRRRNFSSVIASKASSSPARLITGLIDVFLEIMFQQIQHTEVQQLLQNDSENFDLTMIEMVFPVHIGLTEKIKAPVVGIMSMDASHDLHEVMGNQVHSVLYPESFVMPSMYPLTFWERILSTMALQLLRGYYQLFLVPNVEKRMKEIFGENCRSLKELYGDLDMLFANSNPVFHHVRALAPNTITFGGGSHLEAVSKPLPKDLETFLDSASNGVVYVSLGTNIKSNSLRNELKQVFLDTFTELPYKVLWKFESENLTITSENIMIRKWMPQYDVLRHPNVKVFVTQCGLQSSEEAILGHVPMVGLPFVADQLANGLVLQRKGFGIQLDHLTLTKDVFKESIEEVITNPKYKEKVIEMADLLTDVEMSGLEKVVWWTEYVIRNKGAKHLKPPIFESPFYRYYLLDVIAVVATVMLVSCLGFIKIVSIFVRKIYNKKRKME